MVDGNPLSGSFFDFGIFWYHNAKKLHKAGNTSALTFYHSIFRLILFIGRGPFFYLPKLESSEEAKMWDDILEFSETQMKIPVGTAKVTILFYFILFYFVLLPFFGC